MIDVVIIVLILSSIFFFIFDSVYVAFTILSLGPFVKILLRPWAWPIDRTAESELINYY
jgi:hypothetical protein